MIIDDYYLKTVKKSWCSCPYDYDFNHGEMLVYMINVSLC